MTIEESISIQKTIADPNLSFEDAVKFLMEKVGISEPRARERVYLTRGEYLKHN